MKKQIYGFLMIALLAGMPLAWADNYAIDAQHTTVSFKIKHIFTKVQGTFKEFSGSFVYEPGNPANWSVEATIQTASIDTGVAKRDDHLRTKDFFDVETFPTITFQSTEVTDATETTAKIHGNLTLHGVTKPVVLDLDILGAAKDPYGNETAGFQATTTINRKEFGLEWNQVLETGQLLVGEDVEITLDVAGIKQ